MPANPNAWVSERRLEVLEKGETLVSRFRNSSNLLPYAYLRTHSEPHS